MKQFTTPGLKETRVILAKMKVRKGKRHIARANLEHINSLIEDAIKKCKHGSPGKQS